jgi:phage/plasmid-like protein (TIGR03299 family)
MTSPTYDPTESDWATRYDVVENPRKHGIDTSVEGGAFASVRVPAWHRLGVVAEFQVSASRLLEMANADFPIFRGPITTRVEVPIAPGSPIHVFKEATDPRRFNICRTHPVSGDLEILGQASDGYPLWTPRDVLVGFGDGIVAYGEPTVSTCGVLDGGRQVFMAFELPTDVTVGGMEREMRLWMVVSTSFDQSAPTMAMVTPIRTVCANTLRVGKIEALGRFSVRKTRNAELATAQARSALDLVMPVTDVFQAEAEAMLSVQVTNDKFAEIIADQFGPGEEPSKRAQGLWETKQTKLMELFTKADTQANIRNTGYGAYNAVIEYCDWETRVRGAGDRDAARFRRSVIDAADAVTQPKRWMREVILDMAGASA